MGCWAKNAKNAPVWFSKYQIPDYSIPYSRIVLRAETTFAQNRVILPLPNFCGVKLESVLRHTTSIGEQFISAQIIVSFCERHLTAVARFRKAHVSFASRYRIVTCANERALVCACEYTTSAETAPFCEPFLILREPEAESLPPFFRFLGCKRLQDARDCKRLFLCAKEGHFTMTYFRANQNRFADGVYSPATQNTETFSRREI